MMMPPSYTLPLLDPRTSYVMVSDACLPFQATNTVLAASPGVLALATQSLEAEIWTFCVEHSLSSQIPKMLEQIRLHFDPVGPARFSLITDPDSDEEYLRVGVTVAGTVNDVADAYDRYVAGWIRSTPPRITGVVRLSLTIA